MTGEAISERKLIVSVGVSPSGHVLLDNERRLLKPALLYADHVVLYSPTATMLMGMAQLADPDSGAWMKALEHLAEDNPELRAGMDLMRSLESKPHKTKQELVALHRLRSVLRDSAEGAAAATEEGLFAARADELAPALEKDLLTIDTLGMSDAGGTDALIENFVAELGRLLGGEETYPLLDESAADLVRAGLAEGLLDVSASARRKGQQVGAAAEFMERLPAFPEAELADIMDIRDELRMPLTRFRKGVVEVSRLLSSAAHEKDFRGEVDDVYLTEVGPALEELRERMEANIYLKQLARRATRGSGIGSTVLTSAAAWATISLGLTSPETIASAAALAVTGLHLFGATERGRRGEEADIGRQRFYFLLRTNALLQRS